MCIIIYFKWLYTILISHSILSDSGALAAAQLCPFGTQSGALAPHLPPPLGESAQGHPVGGEGSPPAAYGVSPRRGGREAARKPRLRGRILAPVETDHVPQKGRYAAASEGRKAGLFRPLFLSGLFRRGEATAPPVRMTGGAAPSPPERFPESQELARLPAGRTQFPKGKLVSAPFGILSETFPLLPLGAGAPPQ